MTLDKKTTAHSNILSTWNLLFFSKIKALQIPPSPKKKLFEFVCGIVQKQQNKFVILSKVSQIELKASTLSVILDNLLTLTIARELS